LDLDALVLDLVVEGLGEIEHECLGAAVDAVEQLRVERNDGRDVDDEPLRARDETGQSRGGEARQRGDVQLDHVVHLVDVGIDQLGDTAEAGVVDQGGDAAVRTQALFYTLEVGSDGEVGGQSVSLAAGLRGD